MLPFSLLITALLVVLAPSAWGQIVTYNPSRGNGIAYRVNIPKITAQLGYGPIYFQLEAPENISWFALGQGSQMTQGNLFVIYSAPGGNVTLSTRSAYGHYQPSHDPSINATLLEGSGIRHGLMVANIQCDSCMSSHNGINSISNSSNWIWALNQGHPLKTTDVAHPLYQHDWHGIFTLDLTQAIGGNIENPFITPFHTIFDYTRGSRQQQISDGLLHKKRIAHGVMTSVAFVLLFPNFALTLYIPSRLAVPAIHAPLQMFAVLLALAGFSLGISVADDLQEMDGYHSVIGYLAVIGVAIFQPILGIIQHLRFRKTREKSLYGVIHRWFGRFCTALGVINGGIGFHYAMTKNPDIPPASPLAYGIIAGAMFLIYVGVLLWIHLRRRARSKAAEAQAQAKLTSQSQDPLVEGRYDGGDATPYQVDVSKEKQFMSS